jgi:hypothetical protein
MRQIGLVVVAVLFAACSDGMERPPADGATVDAPVEPPPQGTRNLLVPVGASCEDGEGFVCGDGVLGACLAGACRQQCSATVFPRCPMGFAEDSETIGGRETCVCTPG